MRSTASKRWAGPPVFSPETKKKRAAISIGVTCLSRSAPMSGCLPAMPMHWPKNSRAANAGQTKRSQSYQPLSGGGGSFLGLAARSKKPSEKTDEGVLRMRDDKIPQNPGLTKK